MQCLLLVEEALGAHVDALGMGYQNHERHGGAPLVGSKNIGTAQVCRYYIPEYGPRWTDHGRMRAVKFINY